MFFENRKSRSTVCLPSVLGLFSGGSVTSFGNSMSHSIQTRKRFKRMLFLRTKCNMQHDLGRTSVKSHNSTENESQ